MLKKDRLRRRADRLCRHDKFLIFQAQYLAAYNARHIDPVGRTDCDDNTLDARTE